MVQRLRQIEADPRQSLCVEVGLDYGQVRRSGAFPDAPGSVAAATRSANRGVGPHRNRLRLLSEQVGVRAGTGEDQFSTFSQVDHEPVGFDVTVTIALPLTGKGMILVPRLQGPVTTKHFD